VRSFTGAAVLATLPDGTEAIVHHSGNCMSGALPLEGRTRKRPVTLSSLINPTQEKGQPMPLQPTYPGVYVQEVPSGVRTITGVSTSIAAFIGMVSRGPLALPTRILSFADYERRFGDDTSVSQMRDQVKQFFLNGG
jgi:hypothetical protein